MLITDSRIHKSTQKATSVWVGVGKTRQPVSRRFCGRSWTQGKCRRPSAQEKMRITSVRLWNVSRAHTRSCKLNYATAPPGKSGALTHGMEAFMQMRMAAHALLTGAIDFLSGQMKTQKSALALLTDWLNWRRGEYSNSLWRLSLSHTHTLPKQNKTVTFALAKVSI
jgi:hypothetical protein